jgi:hypothetical protein
MWRWRRDRYASHACSERRERCADQAKTSAYAALGDIGDWEPRHEGEWSAATRLSRWVWREPLIILELR